jgi:hypothetical protein
MPSSTESVIVEIVVFETAAPYTSARRAESSPVVRPFAESARTMSSTRERRRWHLVTIFGSKPRPVAGHIDRDRPDVGQTVFERRPLRELPEWYPAGSWAS